jgi:prepilin-type processing-associated H-X9-DG protein
MPRNSNDDYDKYDQRYEDDDDRGQRNRSRNNRDDRDYDREDDDEDDDDDDRFDRRRGRRDSQAGSSGMGITSLVFGVLSFCCTPFYMLALIFGVIGLFQSKFKGNGFYFSIAGIAVGFIGSAISLGLMLPAIQKVRDSASRINNANDVKKISDMLNAYHEKNGSFPAATMPNNPDLSWRVGILQYIDNGLSPQYDPTLPWNHERNYTALTAPIKYYNSKDDLPEQSSQTRIQGFVGEGAMFDTQKPKGLNLSNVTDGSSNTIFLAESGTLVNWAEPKDMPFSVNGPLPALGHPKRNVFNVLMVDGSVRTVRKSVDPIVFKHYITRNGGEVTPPLE